MDEKIIYAGDKFVYRSQTQEGEGDDN